ncbi:hypothetical protein CN349_20790 [Bacillus cereus]|nr:hypothetical protein CON44_27550 [Bacillus cereus]PEY97543.1 hypothetical protein CN349_20790 [Bacillus cereus]PGK71999.1 hypothetical protein CN924_26690 [Bacillus cereus]PGP66963.1 hypothetical protein CN998_20000 [Bacillus cereus]PGU60854.1 hypothetical protein COD70_03855 [Bacillus cereus]
MRECHGNVYRIVGRAKRCKPALKRKDRSMNYNDIFQCGGCEITRIRHTVSIIFSIQLRSVLRVDSEYKCLLLSVVCFWKWNGVVVHDGMNIAFQDSKQKLK